MATLATFRSSVAGEIGLTNSSAADQPIIDAWINQGVADVVGRSRCKVQSASLALSAGQADYTNSVTAMEILNAWTTFTGQNYNLSQVDAQTLIEMRNSSVAYTSPARYYAFEGTNLLMIYPTPATAASATNPDTFNYLYVPYPTTLSVSSDSPTEIPVEYHPAVEYYAFYRAATYTDDQSSQVGLQYQQQYEMWLKRLKKRVALSGNRVPARARVADGRGFPFHDRSRYPGGQY